MVPGTLLLTQGRGSSGGSGSSERVCDTSDGSSNPRTVTTALRSSHGSVDEDGDPTGTPDPSEGCVSPLDPRDQSPTGSQGRGLVGEGRMASPFRGVLSVYQARPGFPDTHRTLGGWRVGTPRIGVLATPPPPRSPSPPSHGRTGSRVGPGSSVGT